MKFSSEFSGIIIIIIDKILLRWRLEEDLGALQTCWFTIQKGNNYCLQIRDVSSGRWEAFLIK